MSMSDERIDIRLMHESDLPSVFEIERLSFTTPWSKILFFNEIHKQRSIAKVATANGKVTGYICSNYVADEGHILNLAVHPDFRGKGIAKRLFRDILEELKERECRFLFLEVRASNIAARKFYEGFGFEVVGNRKGYYTQPKEDAALMMLKL